MGKSNYPNKLDTSIEIPAVRDNIVEVGSDVLNSLRSAIFNIERSLGLNPQGVSGNTVASRLNRSLDGNGNILKESLDRAGLLSGPVTNSDVAKTAGIEESKLNLNYPTSVLQSEISQIIAEINIISKTMEELAYLFAAHTHLEAKNRHKGIAIDIDAISASESDTGITFSERQTSQDLFESLFSSHINYSGESISVSNRSHKANQIFFDKEDVSGYIVSDDVQGAIEDVLGQTFGKLEEHQNSHHSNGIIRTSTISSPEDETVGETLLAQRQGYFSEYTPSNKTGLSSVSFDVGDLPLAPQSEIGKSDILRVYFANGDPSIDYQVHSVQYSVDNLNILSIKVFGFFERNSEALDTIAVFRNPNAETNKAALLTSVRPWPTLLKKDLIQVANPNAASIITKNIRPSEISLDNRNMMVVVDGSKEIDVDVWDGSSTTGQTVDTIISAMNSRFAEVGASVLAYRVDFDDRSSSQIALVHTVESSEAESFTLSIKRPASDDATDSLGLSHLVDVVVDQGLGSKFFVQGEALSGLKTKLEQAGLMLLEGTSSINSSAVGINFLDYGIKDGDLIVVTNTDSDDGTYVIVDVSEKTIAVDDAQLSTGSWLGEASEDSKFYVLDNCLSLEEFEFYKPAGGSGSAAIVDIFIDKNKRIFYNTIAEYGLQTYGPSGSLISPRNFFGDISVYTESDPGVFSVSLNSDGNPEVSLDSGDSVELLGSTPCYKRIYSGSYNVYFDVFFDDPDALNDKLINEGNFSFNIYGDFPVNGEENLLLSRVLYDSQYSRITGAGSDLPRVFSKLEHGITSDKDLSSAALSRVYQTPLENTRSNGVVRGLELTPSNPIFEDDYYVVDISGGECYVRGKKFVFDKITGLTSDVLSTSKDKVFIAINEWGEIVFAGADSSSGSGACICPFDADSHCILSCLEWDEVNINAIDLRLIINDLDLKVLNSVTVSPQKGMGHFQNFGDAIKYAKRFSDMFPYAGVPTVHLKSGHHKVVVNVGVDEADYNFADHHPQAAYFAGTYINFPINITGEGDSTVLDISKEYLDRPLVGNDDRTNAGATEHIGHLMIAGAGYEGVDGDNSVFDNGTISISNIRLRLTRLMLIDPRTEDDDGNYLNNFVKAKDVTFDYSEKSGFGAHNMGIHIAGQSAETTDSVGNLMVSNCTFINSMIRASHFDESSHKNILINENLFTGNGSEPDNSDLYAFYGFQPNSFSLVPPENNVEIRSNIMPGYMASDANKRASLTSDGAWWSDRLSSSLRVGDHVVIGGSGSLNVGDPKVYGLVMGDARAGETGNGIRVKEGRVLLENGNLDLSSGNLTLTDGDATLTDGNLTLTDGDVILTDGNLTLTDGNLTLTDGAINLEDGDLNINDGRAYFSKAAAASQVNIISTSDDMNSGPELVFRRSSGADGDNLVTGWNLGEVRFGGYEGPPSDTISSSTNGDAAIIAEVATDDWDQSTNRGCRLDFYTTPIGSTSSKRRFRIAPSGQLQISGGTDIEGVDATSEATGTMLIGQSVWSSAANVNDDNWTSKHHMALDANEIQARGFDLEASSLYLNREGGSVFIGDDQTLVDGIGLKVNNTDTSETGFRPTIHASNYKSDFINQSAVLCLEFEQILSSELDQGTIPGSIHTGDTFIRFRASGSTVGSVNADQSTVSFNPFTGQHIAPISGEQKLLCDELGKIVSSDGTALLSNCVSESFSGVRLSCESSDKTVYGVIARTPWLPEEEDWRDFPSGQYAVTVNSLGNGRVWVTNISGDIEAGDYITSSNIPGFGELQSDDILHNYTVAKAVETINWDLVTDVITYNGIDYKKYLIACTYHCG